MTGTLFFLLAIIEMRPENLAVIVGINYTYVKQLVVRCRCYHDEVLS